MVLGVMAFSFLERLKILFGAKLFMRIDGTLKAAEILFKAPPSLSAMPKMRKLLEKL